MGKLGANVHTIYDRLDAKGAFLDNPANPNSRDKLTGESLYKGPVQFPKMVYHPEGKVRVVSPAVPGQAAVREMINRVAKTQEELDGLLKAGWHEHPADALRASGVAEEDLPAKGSVDRVAQLERQMAEQEKELKALRAAKLQDDASAEDE